MTYQEFKSEVSKLYQLHINYKKHEDEPICICGYTTQTNIQKSDISDYIARAKQNWKVPNVYFLKYLNERQISKVVDLAKNLPLEDIIEIFSPAPTPKQLVELSHTNPTLLNIFYSKVKLNEELRIEIEKNFDIFKNRDEYISRYKIVGSNLTKVIKYGNINKIRLSTADYFIYFQSYDLDLIEKTYQFFKKQKRLIRISVADVSILLSFLKDGYYTLALETDFSLTIQYLIQTFNQLPSDKIGGKTPIDKNYLGHMRFKKAKSYSPREAYFLFQGELFELTLRNLDKIF